MPAYRCKICGRPNCINGRCNLLLKFKESMPKVKTHFSGSSPPEIFVGRINYPNVFSGILSPTEKGDTSVMASPEEWTEKRLSINEILDLHGQMIYGRGQSNIKASKSLNSVSQEIALASKPVSTEFFLKKKPKLAFESSKSFSIMANPAPIDRVLLEENPFVEKKVDYLVADNHAKAVTTIKELYSSKIKTSHIQKLLSAGLLGMKKQRKLVPTRWSITAVDDMLGKNLLKKIKTYQEINEIKVFHNYYNGNHFEIILLPGNFSFEVIEVSMTGHYWGGEEKTVFSQDWETFFDRKTYAQEVVGAYYADRLGVCEYLEKIKRQATILVLHEERPEYFAPLGVGIIRESVRKAMQLPFETFATKEEAFQIMGSRLKIPMETYISRSFILKEYGKQRRLSEFL